jgi:hypothetical protein
MMAANRNFGQGDDDGAAMRRATRQLPGNARNSWRRIEIEGRTVVGQVVEGGILVMDELDLREPMYPEDNFDWRDALADLEAFDQLGRRD